MTARTTEKTLSGATLGLTATLPDSYDAAGYSSTDIIWTTIGEIENFGNHGVTCQVVEFTPVATAVVNKIKGSKNYGTMSLMMGSVPSDTGQILLEAAVESTAHYSAKLTYPDGEIHYLDVLVSKKEFQDGEVNTVMKLAVDLAICRKPVVVAAS